MSSNGARASSFLSTGASLGSQRRHGPRLEKQGRLFAAASLLAPYLDFIIPRLLLLLDTVRITENNKKDP